MLRSGQINKKAWTTGSDNIYANNYHVFEAVYGMKLKADEAQKQSQEKTDNLFLNMRGYLILGRIFGIIPISGVFGSNQNELRFNILSFPGVSNLVICAMLSFYALLAIIETMKLPKSNALDIAQSVQGTVFKVWGVCVYFYFLNRANRFISIFQTFGRSTLHFSIKDTTFRRDSILISSLVFLAGLCEVFILHMEYFPQFDHFNGMSKHANATKDKSTLYTYYWRSHPSWNGLLGYHPIFALVAFISHKFVVAAWNYVDVLGIILSRALYFKFKTLCNIAEKNLPVEDKSAEIKPITMQERMSWVHIVKDHDTLCSIVDAFEAFLSPLIFGSYATNIYYVCMQLIDGLSPSRTAEENIIYGIFAPFSFILLLVRIFLLSINAARINTYAHEIGGTLKRCPIEFYDAEVSRVDKHVTAGPDIGLTGLGCFCVTKPFLLSIINVVFTVEIVLLQGLSSDITCTAPTK